MREEDIENYAIFENPEISIGNVFENHMVINLICQYNIINKYHYIEVIVYSGNNLENLKIEKCSRISLIEPIYVSNSKNKTDILSNNEIDELIKILSKENNFYGNNFNYLISELDREYKMSKELFWRKPDISMPDYNKLKGDDLICLNMKSLLGLMLSMKKEKLKRN